ncbi:BnaA02g24980D [Brassica napus]|uniref:BnaA02g24980D protein n=1 Tax=Brassica napus TaxID=3708 RepID=A0A078GWH9_BRANA|nr:BnaA02g24980D [Brassica napus]
MVNVSNGHESTSSNKRYRRSQRVINVPCFPVFTGRGQNQNLENHEEAYLEPGEIEENREEWVIAIKDKMKQTLREDATTSWDKLCIYRVPHYLQENDKKSYFPQTVSLGPYHHGKIHLMPMEHHKWRAVNKVMKRNKQQIEMYIDAMKQLEEKSRACYQGAIYMSSNKFTQMLVLDGCFVLELFRGTVDGFPEIGYELNDPVFAMRGLMHSIQRDMIMLENQLPLFVLNRLLGLQSDTQNQTGIAVTERDQLKLMNWRRKLVDNGELHCLDVFHGSIFRTFQRYMSFRNMSMVDKRQQQLIHCVTELREAGVKFRRKKTNELWDIGFKNGYLEIPKLLIHDGTKSLFSNLIAFEQCHIQSSHNITSYIIFMDNLINSSEDVSYLHHCGIIEHWLGSDSEVADLFNRLCKEVVFDPQDSYLSQLSSEVNRYYSLTLLVFTFSQSFYAIYAYYKPPPKS